jgi:hypothetical protein
MAESLQRLRWRRGCLVVLTAALVAAVFTSQPSNAQSRSAQADPVSSDSINANTIAIHCCPAILPGA